MHVVHRERGERDAVGVQSLLEGPDGGVLVGLEDQFHAVAVLGGDC
jgi:hypothetical protein